MKVIYITNSFYCFLTLRSNSYDLNSQSFPPNSGPSQIYSGSTEIKRLGAKIIAQKHPNISKNIQKRERADEAKTFGYADGDNCKATDQAIQKPFDYFNQNAQFQTTCYSNQDAAGYNEPQYYPENSRIDGEITQTICQAIYTHDIHPPNNMSTNQQDSKFYDQPRYFTSNPPYKHQTMTDSNYIDENAPQKFENHQTYMDPSLNPSCN
ncbi:hypothetical protein HZS_4567, partial [Henneguya salminicola]